MFFKVMGYVFLKILEIVFNNVTLQLYLFCFLQLLSCKNFHGFVISFDFIFLLIIFRYIFQI